MQACGPPPQLTPITSTGAASSARGRDGGRRSIGELEVLSERQLRDDRQVARCLPCLVDREQQVPKINERLDHEQVDAALEQAVDLLAKRGTDRLVVEVEHVARRGTERADRAADEGFPTGDIAGLASHLGGAAIEPARLRPRGRTR